MISDIGQRYALVLAVVGVYRVAHGLPSVWTAMMAFVIAIYVYYAMAKEMGNQNNEQIHH
jgi:hypothetical protein